MTWQEALQGETGFLKRGDKEEHREKNKINQNGFKVVTDVGGLNGPVKNTKIGAFPGGSVVKNRLPTQERWVQCLVQEDRTC